MDLFEAIEKRHSYRGPFTDAPVGREDLKKIATAALAAPSGKNCQTTDFVAVDDAELVRQIAAMHQSNTAMQQAKAFIACVTDKTPEAVYEGHSFTVEDCAAAVQNMLLAITALGYASVWIDGWLRVEQRAEKIGDLLNVPADKKIRVLLPIGRPQKQHRQPPKKTLLERTFFNRYQ